jgi:thioredoxin-like negative regulator of GroEL
MSLPAKDSERSPEILFFSSIYCEPCKDAEKLIDKINISMFGNKLNVQKITIDAKNPLIQQYNITSVPALVIAGKKIPPNFDQIEIIDAILQGYIASVKI